MTHELTLISDIGGTHARFAVARDGIIVSDVMVLNCQDFSDLSELARGFLATLEPHQRPNIGIIAVAAPVLSDNITLTNLNWSFSIQHLCDQLNFKKLDVINDFTAIAWAVPTLTEQDLISIGSGTVQSDAPIAIIGPGSGLGIAALIPTNGGWNVLPTESGHVTLAASTFEEDQILDILRTRFGHVSAERVLSGPGLVNLYSAVLERNSLDDITLTAKDICDRAINGSDATARASLNIFYQFLGTVAGNVALNYDARGGVYLAGGILNKQGPDFLRSAFRDRFESKGRYSKYVSKIKTVSIIHPYPALIGMATGLPG